MTVHFSARGVYMNMGFPRSGPLLWEIASDAFLECSIALRSGCCHLLGAYCFTRGLLLLYEHSAVWYFGGVSDAVG